MTLNDIQEADHQIDLFLHPYIYLVNPEDLEQLKDLLPNFESQKDYFIALGYVTKGLTLVVDRAKIEALHPTIAENIFSGNMTKENLLDIKDSLLDKTQIHRGKT